MLSEVPGWWLDAMEQQLGAMVRAQRTANESVEDLASRFLDRSLDAGGELSADEHVKTLALCVAICVRRLAVIDVPT